MDSQSAARDRSRLVLGLSLAVVAIGACLRLAFFDLMEFKFDEVSTLNLTHQSLSAGIPRYGMMSGVGIRNPPGFIWLLMPIVALTTAPIVAALLSAVFNIAAIAALVCTGRAMGAPAAGMWAGALMATHPWLVLYSRKIWSVSLLPLLVVLLMLLVIRCMSRPRAREVFWIPPLVCLIWQLHYSGYATLAFALLWALSELRKGRLHVKLAFLGTLVGLVMLVPYVTFLAERNFADLRSTFEVGAKHFDAATAGNAATTWASTAFAGGLGYPFRVGMSPISTGVVGWWGELLQIIAMVATVAVLVFATCAWLRTPATPATDGDVKHARAWFLFLALLPLCMYAIRGIKSPPHYFIISLPPLLLLAGLGVDNVARRLRSRSWIAVTSGAFVVVTGTIVALSILLAIRRAGGTAGDYGVTYGVQREVATALLDAGVDPTMVDARLTRDRSIGVHYLMVDSGSRPPSVPDRRALLVDGWLAPERSEIAPPGRCVVDRRFGPLHLWIVDPP